MNEGHHEAVPPLTLFAEAYGGGPGLIILHGLFGSLDNWHTMSKRFGEGNRVFALDQRNHGRSPHSDIFTYDAMREDLRGFYAQTGLSHASLLGHSMGGKTAMEFALAYPEMVEKLIVVDIAPRAYLPQHDDLLKALAEIDLARAMTRREVENALGEHIPSIPVRMFLMKNLKRSEDGRFSWKMNLAAIRANYDEVHRAVAGGRVFPHPALFIRAQWAAYISDEDTDDIRALFPRARIATIDAGHWVHAEAPEPFFRTVRQFLDE